MKAAVVLVGFLAFAGMVSSTHGTTVEKTYVVTPMAGREVSVVPGFSLNTASYPLHDGHTGVTITIQDAAWAQVEATLRIFDFEAPGTGKVAEQKFCNVYTIAIPAGADFMHVDFKNVPAASPCQGSIGTTGTIRAVFT